MCNFDALSSSSSLVSWQPGTSLETQMPEPKFVLAPLGHRLSSAIWMQPVLRRPIGNSHFYRRVATYRRVA